VTPYPKTELHVHFEGTLRVETLRQIARRNDYALPPDLELGRFRDFTQFVEVFGLTRDALRTYDDFRRVVVEYVAEAASHGAVYLEGIFSPCLWRGLDQDEVFSGYCDGAEEARELHGVEVRLTPDLPGVYSPEEAEKVATFAVKYRSGVDPRCARHSACRSHPPRHPRRRGSGARVRTCRARNRSRRLPCLKRPPRHRCLSGRSSAAAACCRRGALLDFDRRSDAFGY